MNCPLCGSKTESKISYSLNKPISISICQNPKCRWMKTETSFSYQPIKKRGFFSKILYFFSKNQKKANKRH